MDKKAIIIGGVGLLGVFLLKADNTPLVKALNAQRTLPLTRSGLLEIQKRFGFVPRGVLSLYQKKITTVEWQKVRNTIKTVKELYGLSAAQSVERILYSETSHFKSMLFKATRNCGGILGHDISLYIKHVNGYNRIENTKDGKKFSYRTYTQIDLGLADLVAVLKRHNFNLVAYSGNTVGNDYWNKIKTPIANAS